MREFQDQKSRVNREISEVGVSREVSEVELVYGSPRPSDLLGSPEFGGFSIEIRRTAQLSIDLSEVRSQKVTHLLVGVYHPKEKVVVEFPYEVAGELSSALNKILRKGECGESP